MGSFIGVTVLVFFGDNAGLFYAASAATGQILWVFEAWTEPNATGGKRKRFCSRL